MSLFPHGRMTGRKPPSRFDDPAICIWRDRLDRPNLEVRRQNVAELPLRGSQRNTHSGGKSGQPSKPGASELLSEPAYEKPKLQSLESLPSFCTGCASTAPNSNGQRWLPTNPHRRITEPRRSSGNRRPCGDAGVGAIAPGFAMLARANALHTLIRRRHLTPSCGGPVPTAERTLDPARMLGELSDR